VSKIIQGYHPEWGISRTGATKQEVLDQIGCYEADLRWTEIDKTEFLLSVVPEEFRSRLSYMAYERGHSAGESEVEMILQSLISDLLPCILNFQERLTKQITPPIP